MKRNKSRSFDVIVVGAGMAGLGTAIALTQAGKKVLVISQKKKGESTPAAGGILDPFLEMTPHHPLLKLCREAYLEYPKILKAMERHTGLNAGYRRTGMLFIARNSSEIRELRKRWLWQKKTGIPVVWKTRENILKFFPGVNSKTKAALFYPTVARVNPQKWAKVLKAYLISLGACFLENRGEAKPLQKDQQIFGVTLGSRTFFSKIVVNATGSWAGFKGNFGRPLPVRPAKGQIILLRGKSKISTILHSLDGGYIVPWNDEKLPRGESEYLIGSTVEFVGFNPKVTSQALHAILAKNQRIFPELEKWRRVKAWAGLRPYSKLKVPLIGPSQTKGFYLAAGYYRSGILIGIYAGRLLAKNILTGKIPDFMKPFNPKKFSL